MILGVLDLTRERNIQVSSLERKRDRSHMEPQKLISDENLFREIQTFVEWYPAKKHLYYFAHEHRMTFYHDKFADKDSHTALNSAGKNDEVLCHGCSKPIDHALYGCTKTECHQISFHKACAELPRVIKNHPCHKSHPLTLVQDPSRKPPPDQTSKRKCLGCNLPVLPRDATYDCQEENCKDAIVFHKSCLEFPSGIAYPKHPSHPLLLNHESADGSSTFYCALCSENHSGLNYWCERCDYSCGIRCIFKEVAAAAATNTSGSRSDGSTQGHVLTFHREQPSDWVGDDCLACSRSLSSQPILHCKECKFSLHIHCVLPLTVSVVPPTFPSKFHRHRLALTNYSDKYYKSSGLQWQGCDVCKEFIYPTSSFYYCVKCDFAVDLTCALRQMGMSFAHKLGNLMLTTLPVVIRNPSWTVSEIVGSITKDDQNKIEEIVASIMEVDQAVKSEKDGAGRKLLKEQQDERGSSTRNETLAQGKRPDPKSGEIAESITEEEDDQERKILLKDDKDDSGSSTRKEPLAQIMEIFESKSQDPAFGLTYYDTRSQVTSVDGHIISENLEPVLRALLSKCTDFSTADSELSPHGKTFILVILCAAIYSICNTKDAEINAFQLFTCWDCFKIAQHAGFKIQFAFDRLRKAVLGYFSLGTDPAHADLDNDTAIKLSQELKALEKKCAPLDREMEKLSPDMEALQEKCALRMTTLVSNSMGEASSDIIGIVGQNKVLTSWDDEHWDDPSETSEQDDIIREECLSETSEPERLTLGEEGHKNGTLKLVRYSKAMPASEWQENLMKLIKTFIERKDDEVFLVHKDGSTNVFEQSVPAHDYTSSSHFASSKSSEELQPKINNCGFHNKHTLSLVKKVKDKFTSNKSNKKVKDEAVCIACELPIADAERDKSYNCSKCEIFLHNLCVNLPKEIAKHPLHPAHPLAALDMDPERLRIKTTTCNACGEKFRGSCGYGCEVCNFYLEVQCLFLVPEPTIQSYSHGNLLLLEEKRPKHSPHRCFACGKKIADPPFLRCPPCNISLHVQCPLSGTIARTFHEHDLALTPFYIGDTDKPDCKICKKEMSAMHPTYYCRECGYVAHINCATSNATFNEEHRPRTIRN